MWDLGLLPLLITSSSEHRKHQFFIHSMLIFQHVVNFGDWIWYKKWDCSSIGLLFWGGGDWWWFWRVVLG